MQSVVNPTCFQVSHRIKYVVIICLVFVTFSTCSNDTIKIEYDVFVSFRGVDCRGFLSLRGEGVRLGSCSNLIVAISLKQIAFFIECNIQKAEELFEAPLTSSAFSSDTLQSKSDVFVSFRGPDVREGFLSHLNEALSLNQIASFGDYNIPKGHQISDALLRAIEESSIYLIIFSENYASSSWCLLELVKIVECSRKYGHILLPIFYKVDPSDVRHQRGSYGEAFVAHERQYNPTTVQTWRFALKESANVAGFHSSTFRNDAKLVKEIVKSVLNLKHKVNSKEAYEIGTQFPLAEPLLQIKSEDLPVIRCIEVPYSCAATDEGYAEAFRSSEGICEHQERSLRERFWQCKSKETYMHYKKSSNTNKI